jgi:hypothetical protein
MTSSSAERTAVVDIGTLSLEPHVRQAFDHAWQLTGGRPVGSEHLLRASVAIRGSEAFRALANLLPLTAAPQRATADLPPLDLYAVPVETSLADSYSVAKRLFAASESEVWGRDLITMALLSRNDPALEAVARQGGTTLDDLRAQWRQFLRESDKHRTTDEWDEWWRAAGLRPSLGHSPRQTTVGAYLLTWNPDRYSESTMSEQINSQGEDGSVLFGWSSGNNRSMAAGDRVFLIRQGREPRGLVGVGTISAPPKETAHWDQSKQAEGKTSWIVQVRWEAIQTEPIVDLPTLVSETRESRLWSTPAGGVTIDPAIRNKLEEIWPTAWRASGRPSPDTAHIPDLGPRNLIARFDADVAAATDSLDVQRYVDAFARVAASSTLTPPLSVGIFGDWGSGKTFFMERIEKKIDELAGEEGPDKDLYFHNICQIRFNAWHFAETDLWASLSSTIFKELQSSLDGTKDSDEFTKLAKRLEIARALRAHTEARVQQAGKTLKESEKHVAEAEKQLRTKPAPEQTTDQLQAALKRNLPVGDTMSDLLHEAYRLTGDESFETASKVVDTGQATVEEAKAVFAQTSTMRSRIRFWWRVLRNADLYRKRWFWAVLLLVLAIPALVVLVEHVAGISVNWFVERGFQGLVLIGGLVGLVAKTLAKAEPVFNRLDRIQRSIEREIEQAKEADRKQYKEAVEEWEAAVRDLKEAEESRDKADREFKDALTATQEPTEARLGRFIRGRATSSDYEKHLGVSAMVREDLNELSKLMFPTDGSRDKTLPHIERIILYIDDLDRCYPPTRVVRVLEAVHLLLAFPLFVVFVGVDSRWVSRALNRHYDQMLRDEALQMDDRTSHAQEPATSQDFLEKIFQVPFWLKHMDPTAVQLMLEGLITSDERDDHQVSADESDRSGTRPAGFDMADDVTRDGQGVGGLPDARRVPEDADEPNEVDGYTDSDGENSAPATEALRIRTVEREYMNKVAPLMPRTPRAVKRFVNIYRLYKAALSPSDLDDFLDRDGHKGNFRAVQVLLALVIGTPDLAKAVVEILGKPKESGPQRLSELGAQLPESKDPTWKTTQDALETFAEENDNLPLESLRNVVPWVTRYSLHHMVSAPSGDATLSAERRYRSAT